MEMARQHPNRVSVPELLTELQVTKTELENIKVKFLSKNYKTTNPISSFNQCYQTKTIIDHNNMLDTGMLLVQ